MYLDEPAAGTGELGGVGAGLLISASERVDIELERHEGLLLIDTLKKGVGGDEGKLFVLW